MLLGESQRNGPKRLMKKLYHIQRQIDGKHQLQLGVEYITFSEGRNPYFRGILNGLKRYNAEFDKLNTERKLDFHLQNVNFDRLAQSIETNSKSTELAFKAMSSQAAIYKRAGNALRASNIQYQKLYREEVFERVRLELSRKLPSRKRCIWLSQKEDLMKWMQKISKSFGGTNNKILQIELLHEGKIHTCNEQYISAADSGELELEDAAQKYWTDPPKAGGLLETLYEGSFSVTKEFKSIDDFLRSET
ncbi:MAG: DUF2441 domain-containing protein [Pseudomonadota bacterium]